MYLITGANGFVGSKLGQFLSVNGIDNHPVFRNDFNNFTFSKFSNRVNLPILGIIHLAGKSHDLKKISNPDEYYQVNTELTIKVFDAFLASDAKVFITLSSVKSVADQVQGELTEEHITNPITHYGKSKLLAEKYIFSKKFLAEKEYMFLGLA